MPELTVVDMKTRTWSRGDGDYVYACSRCPLAATAKVIIDHLIDRHTVTVEEAEAAIKRARRAYKRIDL